MPLLEPINFISAPVRPQNTTHPVIPGKAEDVPSCSLSPSPEDQSMTQRSQSLVMPSGVNTFSKSEPPTPPRGPPPTPRRRVYNELSKSDPPTPPRGPPPTPRRRDGDMFNSLSHYDPPSLPNGPPTPRRHEEDMFYPLLRRDPLNPPDGPPPTSDRCGDYELFNSLSRKDPPTPPRGPPPSPCRSSIFNDLSRRDPPTPPRGPPPSPRCHDAESYNDLSRSNPPSPPRNPPPTPERRFCGYSNWTPDEADLLTFVCRSGDKLGWHQIAGLFQGKDMDVCRSKCREMHHEESIPDQHEQGWDSKSYREPLQLYIPTGDEVPPGLSCGPSPMGSPVCDRLIRSWDFSDVECAVDLKVPGMTKTITHLSNELNFALGDEWGSVKGRVQDKHAFSLYSTGVDSAMAPEILHMAE